MFTPAHHPQTIGQTLDSGFKLYAAGFKEFFLLSLLAAVVTAVPSVMGGPPDSDKPPQSPQLWLLMAFSWILYLIIHAAIVTQLGYLARTARLSVADALRIARKRSIPLLMATVCCFLAIAGGMVLLVIPGLYLMVSLYLYMPALLLDNRGPVDALKRSHQLVRRNWWRTATVVSVPVFIMIIMYFGLGLVAGLVLIGTNDPLGADPMLFVLLVQFGSTLVTALIVPLLSATVIVQYHDLALRREGADLEARIAAPVAAH